MSKKLKHFVAGATGVVAFEIALFARHPEAIQHHADRFGAAGIVVAASALVLLAALTGLVVLATRPRNLTLAFLGGVIPPALLVAAGLPKYGFEDQTAPIDRVMVVKPKPAEALWLPMSPVRHVADGTTAMIRAREARVVAEAVAQAERRAGQFERAAVAAAVDKATAAAKSKHDAELTSLRAQLQRDRADAFAQVQAEHAAHLAKVQIDLEREREAAKIAVEAQNTAQTALAAQKAELASLWKKGNGSEALRVQITKLRGELDLAADRRAEITRQREDYRRLIDWYFVDVPPTGDRPFKVLSKRLASRDAADRVVAARLMVLCGAPAKPILRRALADHNESVREAVETSLVVLDR